MDPSDHEQRTPKRRRLQGGRKKRSDSRLPSSEAPPRMVQIDGFTKRRFAADVAFVRAALSITTAQRVQGENVAFQPADNEDTPTSCEASESQDEQARKSSVKSKAIRASTPDDTDTDTESPPRVRPLPAGPFACRWQGCRAELINLDTLKLHLVQRHGRRIMFITCRWSDCNADAHTKHALDHPGYEDEKVWIQHMEHAHMRPIAWKYGDGPVTALTVRARKMRRHLWAKADNIEPSAKPELVEEVSHAGQAEIIELGD